MITKVKILTVHALCLEFELEYKVSIPVYTQKFCIILTRENHSE